MNYGDSSGSFPVYMRAGWCLISSFFRFQREGSRCCFHLYTRLCWERLSFLPIPLRLSAWRTPSSPSDSVQCYLVFSVCKSFSSLPKRWQTALLLYSLGACVLCIFSLAFHPLPRLPLECRPLLSIPFYLSFRYLKFIEHRTKLTQQYSVFWWIACLLTEMPYSLPADI